MVSWLFWLPWFRGFVVIMVKAVYMVNMVIVANIVKVVNMVKLKVVNRGQILQNVMILYGSLYPRFCPSSPGSAELLKYPGPGVLQSEGVRSYSGRERDSFVSLINEIYKLKFKEIL